MDEQDRVNEQLNDDFIRNRKIQKEKRMRKRRITSAVLIVLVLVISLGAYLITTNQFIRGILYHDLNQKAAVTIPVDSSFVTEYDIFKQNIISCSKNGVKAYNMNGKPAWETTLSNLSTQMINFNSPVLKTASNHCIVYDKGGKSILKFNERSVSPLIQTDYGILFAKLFDNGFIAVVTEDSGSKEQVKVYDKSGQEVFIWHSGESNILDAALSDNGQRLVVSSLDVSKGKLLTNLTFFQVNQTEPYAASVKENMLLTNLKFYNGNKNTVGISDTGVYHFNEKGEVINSYEYSGRELSCFEYLDGGQVALVFNSNYESKYRVVILDENGMEKGTYVSDKEIDNLSFDGRNILANVSKGFHVVNLNGKELRRQEISKEIKKVLSGGKGKIVMVGTTEIDIVN